MKKRNGTLPTTKTTTRNYDIIDDSDNIAVDDIDAESNDDENDDSGVRL